MTIALIGAFSILVFAAGVGDLLTMTIPNRISLVLAALFIAFAFASGMANHDVLQHLGIGALVLAVGFLFFTFGWIGGGDAKLAAAIALWLGFDSIVEYLLVAAIAGGGLTLALLSMRALPLPAFALGWDWLTRLHHPKTGIPYGVALAAAALFILPETALWRSIL
jgi:prepilin peptidase CpaA